MLRAFFPSDHVIATGRIPRFLTSPGEVGPLEHRTKKRVSGISSEALDPALQVLPRPAVPPPVMAGLVPAIHVCEPQRRQDVDPRDKAGDNDGGWEDGTLVGASCTGREPDLTSGALEHRTENGLHPRLSRRERSTHAVWRVRDYSPIRTTHHPLTLAFARPLPTGER